MPGFHLKQVFAAALALALSNPVTAQDPAYLRGYFDALIDDHYPGLETGILSIDADNRVLLSGGNCFSPTRKRDIVRLLQETGKVTAVYWENADCPSATPSMADIHALPEQPVFDGLVADPRQARFSVSYQRYKISGRTFNASNTSFGEYFGLAEGFLGESGVSQIGIQGAVFALFDLDSSSKDLINADYWIGFPITYRKNAWAYMLKIYHQSSHLGDEFILNNPDIDRINLSYEDITLLVSYEWDKLRLYGGAGYLLHREPELERQHWQAGAEFVYPQMLIGLDWIAAVDIQASEEADWKRSYSFKTGLEFKNRGRRLRLLLEHFDGNSPNGQFFREDLRYTGVGLDFGF
ncbi:MAG TPA: DUF1207 domain-containing protein [Gammaproteobacteria bacterium]